MKWLFVAIVVLFWASQFVKWDPSDTPKFMREVRGVGDPAPLMGRTGTIHDNWVAAGRPEIPKHVSPWKWIRRFE